MKPKLILFDLGRVLADLGSPSTRMRLPISDEEFWGIWLNLPIVQAFEGGEIGPDQFLANLASELGIGEDRRRFRQRFLDWYPRLFPGVEALISSLAAECKLALLSNTNTLHWDLIQQQSPIFHHFDHLFLSYEIRRCKPAKEAFELVLKSVGESSADILFLDDMEQNIAAAAKIGLRAVQTNGIVEVRTALARAGFIIPTDYV